MNDLTEARKPPVATTGILGWLRINLFSNWVNSLITLFVLYILIQFIPWILNWTIFAADFKYNFKKFIVCIDSISPYFRISNIYS